MYRFMSSDGIMANTMEVAVLTESTWPKVGAAKTCKAGMAKAEPMIVCGRVNLQRTIGKGGFTRSSPFSLTLAVVDICKGEYNLELHLLESAILPSCIFEIRGEASSTGRGDAWNESTDETNAAMTTSKSGSLIIVGWLPPLY
jgi:hypothetical protein